jgi:hypothetical protein
MSMADLVLRLISGWYDPDTQSRREHRTAIARSNAISVRKKAEVSDTKIAAVQRCYQQADASLRQHDG